MTNIQGEPWSKKKQRVIKKKKWESFSPQARAIARSLKAADLLKVPGHMRGWGLAAYLLNIVAENIDKVIAEMEAAKKNPWWEGEAKD